MAQRLMNFPNVLWEVQNVYSEKTKASSTFTFLGVNWKLQLVRQFNNLCTTRGQFIRIYLKILSPSSKIPCLLCAKTSLVGDNASYFETYTSIDTSSLIEWCLWDENRLNIGCYVKGSTLTFRCYIQPESSMRSILHENADTGLKFSEGSADIECLRKDLGNLFDKHIGADVIFTCKGEKIYAHKTVLSGRSQVLAAMLQSDTYKSLEGVIYNVDTEPFILRLFLRYLYTGDLPYLSLNTAMKFYFLADKYAIDILKKNCVFFMLDNFEIDDSKGNAEKIDDSEGNAEEIDNSEGNAEEIDDSECYAESSIYENLKMKIQSRLKNIKEVLCTDNWKNMNEEQLKMSLDSFHNLFKGIYSETGTGKLNEVTSLNHDMQTKKIKLMESECNEEIKD